jgi:hypothetical protein
MKNTKMPVFLTTIGKSVTTRDPVTKRKTKFVVEDEIRRPQTEYPCKMIVLQKLRYQERDLVEFRLGYYIIGKRPRMAGKWTWGQYATFLPQSDFQAVVDEARRKKWIR